jgi:D-serine dehydratase
MYKENNLQKMLTDRPLSPVGKGLGDLSLQPSIGSTSELGWNLLRLANPASSTTLIG